MSHFVTYHVEALKNPNMEIFKESLKEMGLTMVEKKEVANVFGSAKVDFGLMHGSHALAVGFAQTKNGLELRGDFWGTGIDDRTFLDDVSQLYVKNTIIEKLESTANYTVENTEVLENGEIELTVNMA